MRDSATGGRIKVHERSDAAYFFVPSIQAKLVTDALRGHAIDYSLTPMSDEPTATTIVTLSSVHDVEMVQRLLDDLDGPPPEISPEGPASNEEMH